MRTHAQLAWVLAGGFGVVTAVVSCSLGLDESKIRAPDAGSGPVSDGGTKEDVDSGGVLRPETNACTRDDECTTTHGCLKGRCDLSRKACVFDVCKPSPCNVAACDLATQTCGAPKAYPYKVNQFAVGVPVLGRGLVAVHPYLFALTGSGVVAFNMANPTSAPPPAVPIVGLGFVPVQMVASGSRVYFSAGLSGPAPSRLPLAWIDVPADPFVSRLVVNTVLVSYNRPAEGYTLLARGGDSAQLVGPGGATQHSAVVQAPLTEPASVASTPLVLSPNTSPVVMSGDRLVTQGYSPPSASAVFGFIDNAGMSSQSNLGETAFTAAGLVAPPQAFATSADGAVFWSITAPTGVPNPNPGQPQPATRAVRGYFIVPDANGALDPTKGTDVEVYAPGLGYGAGVVGQVALLDASTALVITGAKENPGTAVAVQFVKRDPLGVVKNADDSPRRAVIGGAGVGAFVGATGSNGIGYVVANEGAPTITSATVHVFDPACAP